MSYKCPECGYTSEEAGDCPSCSIPMVEEEGGEEALPESAGDEEF